MEPVEVISDPVTALAALDPLRSRLLAELQVPASASQLAGRLGMTRQVVNYHLRKLEDQRLVTVADTRQWGGLTERRLVASASGYVVSPEALGDAAADPRASRDRLSAGYLLALAGRLIREVGGMSLRAGAQGVRLPVLAVDADVRFGSPGDRAAFADELADAVVRLAARYHDETATGGRWHRVLVGVHPIPADVPVGTPTEEEQ